MDAILAVVLVNVLPFASAPGKVGIDDSPDGDFIPFNGIDAGSFKLGEEFCPLFSGCGRAYAFTVSADGFPMAFALVVCLPEHIDEIGLACARIAFGGLAAENALELGFYVFSACYVAHEGMITTKDVKGKMVIHSSSKTDFRDKIDEDSYLFFMILFAVVIAICEGERGKDALGPVQELCRFQKTILGMSVTISAMDNAVFGKIFYPFFIICQSEDKDHKTFC